MHSKVCSIGFLEVEPTDKVAVVDALGYWTEDAGKLLRESSNVGSLSNISLPRMPSEDRMESSLGKEKGPGGLTAKERSGILEAINTALAQQQNENMMPGMRLRCVGCSCVNHRMDFWQSVH